MLGRMIRAELRARGPYSLRVSGRHASDACRVVVDGTFSMEGDIAPLPAICDLCERYGARLMVDEAHGVGVLGERGAGACEAHGVEGEVDLRMGTFSKSLASCGGFIAGPADVIDFLRTQSRTFMFTAASYGMVGMSTVWSWTRQYSSAELGRTLAPSARADAA